MDICNGGYAAKHFPARHWMFGDKSLSLADFEWDSKNSRMFYGGFEFKYGEELNKPEKLYSNPTRLYNLSELKTIFQNRSMEIQQAYGHFNKALPVSDDMFQMEVYSRKIKK